VSTTPLELPIARSSQVAPQRLDPRDRDRPIHRARALSHDAERDAERLLAISAKPSTASASA